MEVLHLESGHLLFAAAVVDWDLSQSEQLEEERHHLGWNADHTPWVRVISCAIRDEESLPILGWVQNGMKVGNGMAQGHKNGTNNWFRHWLLGLEGER